MRIALIGCTNKKKNYMCQAKELYSESTLFKSAYNYASKVCDKIYILSAKYGLLKDTDVIEPYNVTLNKQKTSVLKEWSKKVFAQYEQEFNLKENIIFECYAGKNYRKFLIPLVTNKYPSVKFELPVEHLGIGKQIHFFHSLL